MSDRATIMSRRSVLAGTGALIVSFSCAPKVLGQEAQNSQNDGKAAGRPGSLSQSPFLDAWIRIDADDRIAVFTGKAELGQGMHTAQLQLIAEELSLPIDRIGSSMPFTATTYRSGTRPYARISTRSIDEST